MLRSPFRYCPVSDAGLGDDRRGRALGDDVAAVLAGPGTEVDDVVGGAHRALVVLDHDHRVAEVAQPLQGPDQLRVVALVQADRRLVEDVEDADQARADLGREADPLRLPAGERACRPGQVQVADADVVEEGEALLDLAHDQARDRPLGVGQLQLVDPLCAARAESWLNSSMFIPPIVTARLSGRSRAPSHCGQGCSAM